MKSVNNHHAPGSVQPGPRRYIRPSRRRAFSFAEVMFAVVILGIGFIMVAAIFPVTIQQTQANNEENIAAALARQAANSISQLPTTLASPFYNVMTPMNLPSTVQTQLLFPPTIKYYVKGTDASPAGLAVAPPAVVVPFIGNRWELVKSNVILPSDPRYGYVMFYKRENNSPTAELIVVAVAIRNRPVYDATKDLSNTPAVVTVNTTPTDMIATAASPKGQTVICPDTITLSGTPVEGSYVEMAVSTVAPPTSPMGRSYGIGRMLNTGVFEITPGDSTELTAGSTGLWGTTTLPATTPIIDTAAAGTSGSLYGPSTLQPTVAYAKLTATVDAPAGRIQLFGLPQLNGASTAAPPNAVQGAFVIIADDFPYNPTSASSKDYPLPDNVVGNGPSLSYSVGALNGRIFRLGAPATTDASGNLLSPGTFNLDPVYGMRPASSGSSSPDTVPNPVMAASMGGMSFQSCAKVYIIGAGATFPGSVPPYSGQAQDIGVFASYFQVQ